MQYKVEGKLHVKGDTQQVTDKFQKREFVIHFAENPSYPQYIKFEALQERCSIIDPFDVGDMVEVSFNLKGREWNSPQGETKYFTSLEAWRVQAAGAGGGGGAQESAPEYDLTDAPGDGGDDLPF